MNAHTPGPWKWVRARSNQHLQDANGFCFAQVTMPAGYPGYENDAKLIAAAPELLEALKDIVCKAESMNIDLDDNRRIGKAKKAIAKAEGRL